MWWGPRIVLLYIVYFTSSDLLASSAPNELEVTTYRVDDNKVIFYTLTMVAMQFKYIKCIHTYFVFVTVCFSVSC